jgi:hypothetical protein
MRRNVPAIQFSLFMGILCLSLSPCVKADLLPGAVKYEFSGALLCESACPGNGMVNGTFTYNARQNSFGAFDFATPFGVLNSDIHNTIGEFSAAQGFVLISFDKGASRPADDLQLLLVLQGDSLPGTFHTSPFFLSLPEGGHIEFISSLTLGSTLYPGADILDFKDGKLKVVETPEPSSLILLGAGLFVLAPFLRRR